MLIFGFLRLFGLMRFFDFFKLAGRQFQGESEKWGGKGGAVLLLRD